MAWNVNRYQELHLQLHYVQFLKDNRAAEEDHATTQPPDVSMVVGIDLFSLDVEGVNYNFFLTVDSWRK